VPLTYIAGYNESEASRAAVRLVARLGKAAGARVFAVSVYATAPKGVKWDDLREEIERPLRMRAAEMLGDVGEEVETRVYPAPSPADGLREFAEEEGASLIAVGTTHHGRAGRLLPGSVATHLLVGAECPIVVVPPGAAQEPISTIGVAFDGRPESVGALATAERLAKRIDARLVVIAVCDPPQPLPVPAVVGFDPAGLEKDLRRDLDAAVEKVTCPCEAKLVHGNPQHALVEEGNAVDLLVTGSRSQGPMQSVLLGSVSRYVVDHATCPVMVVPRTKSVDLDEAREATAMHGA
jgi:nucleotide-binding universal stress UspA family protein